MADVELQAVVSIDSKESIRLIERDIKKLGKEVEGLLQDTQIKLGLNDREIKQKVVKAMADAKNVIDNAKKNLKIETQLDLREERRKFNQIQSFARDTGKKIDQELATKLNVDIAQATLVLKQVRKEIRETTDKEQLIKLNIEGTNVQSQLTEFKKRLRDLKNTGDVTLSRLQQNFNNVKSSIGGVISLLQGGLGFIGLGIGLKQLSQGFSTAVQTALSFERAFTNIQKTFKGTEQEFNSLKNSLIDLSQTELPLPVEELSNIAALGSQLGVAGKDILKFTDTIARLGVSTNLTTEEAAESLAKLVNVFELPISSVEQLGSALVELGNNSATTEKDILNFARFLGPAGKQAGLTAQDVLSIGAALSSVGINAEAGGSAISKSLNVINTAIATGSSDIEKFAEVSGVSAEKFKELREGDTAQAFTLFVEGLGKAGDQATLVIDDLIGSDVRLRNALLATAGAGDVLRRSFNFGNKAVIENNALLKESSLFFNDAKANADRYNNSIRVQTAEIGNLLLPIYNLLQGATLGILQATKGVINFFSEFGVVARALTLLLGALSVALLPVSGPFIALGVAIAGVSKLIKDNVFGLGDLVNKLFGLKESVDTAALSVEDLGKKYQENSRLIKELSNDTETNAKEIANLTKENEELIQTLGITSGSVGELTQKYFDNEKQLKTLDNELEKGNITQELYSEKTNQIAQQQLFLSNALGVTGIAQEQLLQLQKQYNESNLDTSVSRQELEALRIKAIQTTESIIQALLLQREQEKAALRTLPAPLVQSGEVTFTTDTTKQLKEAQAFLKRLRNEAETPVKAPKVQGSSSGGGTRRQQINEEQKLLEEAKKNEESLLEELNKKKQQLSEEEQKRIQELVKFQQDSTKKVYDQTVQQIEKSQKAIDDYNKRIDELKSSLLDLDTQQETTLAQRTVEIQNQLKEGNLDIQERLKLEKELALATQNTTQEEIARARLLSEETVTERILRETQEKREQIEGQIAIETEARDREVQVYNNAILEKERINNEFFNAYKTSVEDAYNTELQKLLEIKRALDEVRIAKASLGISEGIPSSSGTSNTINNIQPNISVQATINNDTDIDQLGKQLAQQIINGTKGIL